MTACPLRVRIAERVAEARDVVTLELRSLDERALPVFAPGAHLEIALPNGLIRHYSLCNDSRERDRYVIGVGRAADSRGGSRYIHESLRVGDTLEIGAVRNNFPMVEGARRYRFIAGGIGITPLLAMIRQCEAQGADWSLLYCIRSRQRSAFHEVLVQWPDRVRYHTDDEAPPDGPDLVAALAAPVDGEQVYCCGPDGLMRAVSAAAADWPAGSVHFEWFSAPVAPAAVSSGAKPFRVLLRRQGITLDIAADRSILDTLEDHGIMVPCACREGLCRACETTVCAGEVEHRDFVLSGAERSAGSSMMICVSRARSASIELDL